MALYFVPQPSTSWPTYHLVEHQIDVQTIMSIGGWSGYSVIEPYLSELTEARIGKQCGIDRQGVICIFRYLTCRNTDATIFLSPYICGGIINGSPNSYAL